jgi:ELWxxDGT repeat protein
MSATLVADLFPGPGGSNPANLLADPAGGVYFTASDGTPGRQLWHSDGTASGTSKVAVINPGPTGFDPQDLVAAPGKNGLLNVFFSADDGNHGHELWQSDGTAQGTALVADINPGPAGSDPRGLAVLQAAQNPSASSPVLSTLLYTADDGVHGRQLWETDPVTGRTGLLQVINPGVPDPHIANLTPRPVTRLPGAPGGNGYLPAAAFFTAQDGKGDEQLWVTDGTAGGTVLLRAFGPSHGPGDDVGNLTYLNGTLFFTADDGAGSVRLWKSDGTAAGTTLVSPGGPAAPASLNAWNGSLYFTAAGGSGGQLWRSNGTAAGTTLVTDVNPGGTGSRLAHLTGVSSPGFNAGALFFESVDPTHGKALWKSDGTAAGTLRLLVIDPHGQDTSADQLVNASGVLEFAAPDGSGGWGLWQSDGRPGAGTALVQDFHPGPGGAGPADLTFQPQQSGSFEENIPQLFFTADDGSHGRELWQTFTDIPLSLNANGFGGTEGTTFSGVVATFSASDPNPADYQVSVDGAASVSVQGTGGNFSVYVTYGFTDEGRDMPNIAVSDARGGWATTSVQVDVEPTMLNPVAQSLAVSQNTPFTGTVATFTDPDPNARVSEYGVTIDWGDGTTTLGTVKADPKGGFDVSGSHQWSTGGLYPVQVQITNGLTDTANLNTATVTSTALVTSPAFRAKAVSASVTENTVYSGPVASFTEAGPPQPPGRYNATVIPDLDPGSAVPGLIVADGHGGFVVRATLAGFPFGTNGITVVIAAAGGDTTAVHGSLTVLDAPLSAAGLPVAAVPGKPFGGAVATFHDPAPYASGTVYHATIDWGDGTPASVGSVQANGGGNFTVSGNHHYARAGSYTVRTAIGDPAGSTVTASGTATVALPPLAVGAVWAPTTLAGTPAGPLTLVDFQDAAGFAGPAAYQATIAWGDGTTTAGRCWGSANGLVRVSGQHTYLRGGTFHPVVTLRSRGVSATATATVQVETDVSAQARASLSAFVYHPATGLYTGTLTLTNTGGADLSGPLWVVLKGLDRRLKPVGAFGATVAGEPEFRLLVRKWGAGKALTVALQIAGPPGLAVGATAETFARS